MERPNRFRSNPIWTTSGTFCTFFLAFSAIMPFLTIYYESAGLTGTQIGFLSALPSMMRIAFTPIWGGLADMMQKSNRILAVALLGSGIAGYGIYLGSTFWTIFLAVFVMNIMTAPIVPLMDSGTLQVLGDRPERYGRIRLWGSLGWIVGSVTFGRIIDQYSFAPTFLAYLIGMIVSTVLSLTLPAGKTNSHNYWQTLRQLSKDARWIRFLALLIMCGFAGTWFNAYLGLRIKEIGGTNAAVGIAFAIATASEIVFFYFGDQIQNRRSAHTFLLIGLAAYAVRMIATGSFNNPILVIATQLLHGVTFGLVMLAAVPFANKLAPDNLKATAQSILSVAMGVGSILGAFIGGILLDVVGLAAAFQIGSIIMTVSLLLFIVAHRKTPQ